MCQTDVGDYYKNDLSVRSLIPLKAAAGISNLKIDIQVKLSGADFKTNWPRFSVS